MQLLRDSTFQKIKAIVNIRAAYNKFMKIEAWEKTLNESGEELDIETKAGMHFGVGAFNMVSSLLPPKVLALVSFLGFPHDRQFGLDELQKTLDGGGVRSPVAALALLLHHVYLQGSFCHTGELPHAAAATKVLDQSLELFPNGGIFLFMKVRDTSRSIPPPWRSIRFRLALRTYAPWGVRVVSQTKSRKIPARKILPLCFASRPATRASTRTAKEPKKSGLINRVLGGCLHFVWLAARCRRARVGVV